MPRPWPGLCLQQPWLTYVDGGAACTRWGSGAPAPSLEQRSSLETLQEPRHLCRRLAQLPPCCTAVSIPRLPGRARPVLRSKRLWAQGAVGHSCSDKRPVRFPDWVGMKFGSAARQKPHSLRGQGPLPGQVTGPAYGDHSSPFLAGSRTEGRLSCVGLQLRHTARVPRRRPNFGGVSPLRCSF